MLMLQIPLTGIGKCLEDIPPETHDCIHKPIEGYGSRQRGSGAMLKPASVSSLLIPNAAKPGFDGLLTNLLIWEAEREHFGTDAARFIIKLKWELYARNFVYREVIWHSCLLSIFTIYW